MKNCTNKNQCCDEEQCYCNTTFSNLKEAEDFYFENHAKNNEDEAGLEKWLESVEILES